METALIPVSEQDILPTNNKKESALIKAGATREVAYKAMVEGLNAESMTVDKYGDEHMTPDHQARLKAAEMISRLHGDLKAEGGSNTTYNTVIQSSSEEMKVFSEMIKDVKEQLDGLVMSGRQTGDVLDAEYRGDI